MRAIEPERFTEDGPIMTRRIKRRLGRLEVFAVLLNLGFVVMMFILTNTADSFEGAPDYNYYINAVHGDFGGYFYMHWLLPVFTVLDLLPAYIDYLLWGSVSVLSIFIAARIFGARVPAAMLTYQMFFATFYGQITGVIAISLALFWWGMAHRKWDTAGFFLLVACTKFHIAVPFALAMWLMADITWRERFRILITPAVLALLSVIVYPLWPLDLLHKLRTDPPYDEGSLALWQWIGPLALLVWVPALLLPMSRGQRLIAIGSATALGLPYYQQADLLLLYTFPIGWLGLLGNAGFLYFWFTDQVLRAMVAVPLVIYVYTILPPLIAWVRSGMPLGRPRTAG